MHRLETLQNLARAPAVSAVLGENQINCRRRRFIRRRERCATLFLQAADAERQKALAPFVARVTTDALPRAQFSHGPLPTREVLCEVMPLNHGIGLLPGHRPRLSEMGFGKCHPCPRTSVN